MDTKRFVELKWVHYVYEFFIVAIGISIPFLLDRWNDNRLEKRAERENYEYILQELKEDKEELQGVAEENRYFLERLRVAGSIIRAKDTSQADTLGRLAMELRHVSDFHRNHSIYENLINSDKIKLVRDRALTNRLQQLDELSTYINRLETNHLDAVINFAIPALSQYLRAEPYKVMDPDALFGYPFHNQIVLFISIMEEKEQLYQRTLQEIGAVEALVREELSRK
ncbi:MAG: hypothetical protein J5I98_17605 [Phaeodactylibacter sp.]|nr:hypothetical protein [Phaeodactylibacter sp.]